MHLARSKQTQYTKSDKKFVQKYTLFKRRKQDQQLMYIPFYHKITCDGKKAMAWAQPPFSKNEPNCLSNQTMKEMEADRSHYALGFAKGEVSTICR